MAAEDGNFDRRRAVSLLQEATRLIAEHVESSENNLTSHSRAQIFSSSSTVVQPHHSQATPTTTCILTPVHARVTSQSSSVNSTQRTLGEFRNLFSPHRDRRRSVSSTSQSASSQPKRKKQAQSATQYKRETWTHTFFCLADCKQCAAPNLALKQQLQEAGLGKRKICFQAKASAFDVKAKLEEVYPKLKDGGGFDILRRGVQASELIIIQPPRSGYSVQFLRDAAGLGQAMAFIRPIQCNLNLAPSGNVDFSEVSGFC